MRIAKVGTAIDSITINAMRSISRTFFPIGTRRAVSAIVHALSHALVLTPAKHIWRTRLVSTFGVTAWHAPTSGGALHTRIAIVIAAIHRSDRSASKFCANASATAAQIHVSTIRFASRTNWLLRLVLRLGRIPAA
jgi:hypothetical protein